MPGLSYAIISGADCIGRNIVLRAQKMIKSVSGESSDHKRSMSEEA